MTRLAILLLALVASLSGCARSCNEYVPQPPAATGGSPATGGAPGTGGEVSAGGDQAGGAVAKCEFVEVRTQSRATRLTKPRVVGGRPVDHGAYPWMAALTTPVGFQFCGATLYRARVALTAAHCQVEPGDRIVIGRVDLRDQSTGHVRSVSRSIRPVNYVSPDMGHDVALLLLDVPVEGVPTVQLAPAGYVPIADLGVILGYGLTTEGGSASTLLLKASVPLVDRATCVAQYGGIPLTSLCADGDGVGACQGDSGGYLGADGLQIGVTSYGVGCARPDWAGVYASVAEQRAWIDPCVTELETAGL
jgi:secreted trypsin-like serine protease